MMAFVIRPSQPAPITKATWKRSSSPGSSSANGPALKA
jgi:hypothetical protein